jgi:hypothetical protein
MMVALLCAVLLLLTVAVIALFAMMGELNARVAAAPLSDAHAGNPDPWASAREFRADPPAYWPKELGFRSATELIVVLSTACQTCSAFLTGRLDDLHFANPSFVISTASADRAAIFRDSHPVLGEYKVFVDVMGEWAREQLHVDTSPTALLFRDGVPVAAFNMSDPTALAVEVLASLKEDSWSPEKLSQEHVGDSSRR